jgi:hypothetical protein
MIPARPQCSWAVQPHKQVEAWKARKCIEREVSESQNKKGNKQYEKSKPTNI